VLLKNKDLLPIDTTKVKSIAVIGDDASLHPIATGGGSGGVQLPYLVTPLQGIKSKAGSISVTYAPSSPVQAAADAAKAADLAIVFVGVSSSEGSDRGSLNLPNGQDALIAAVAQAQPNTVVVAHIAGAILMPWVDQVSSILAAWLPGQEDGNAIASVLFGATNPSGRLPLTFSVTASQIPVATQTQYPGINDEGSYSEKLEVGYRWYDAHNVSVLFPFGHGLGYSWFTYSNLQVTGTSTVSVSVDITNSGKWAGAEVPQLYLSYPVSAGEPPKVLRGFTKVQLAAGAKQTVTFSLTPKDFSIWDVTKHDWSLVWGDFTVLVGASSRDIRLQARVTIKG